MSLFAGGKGNTPLSPEEEDDLIPALATKQELNEWERQNILAANQWAFAPRNRRDPLDETYLRILHRHMFDATWKWAGKYRTTEKNIGVPFYRIREELAILLADANFWREHGTYALDELAVRLHHRLVWIHPFANGNGRHARLIADVIASRGGRPVFSWGSAEIASTGQVRRRYIEALQSADKGNIQPLLQFARS